MSTHKRSNRIPSIATSGVKGLPSPVTISGDIGPAERRILRQFAGQLRDSPKKRPAFSKARAKLSPSLYEAVLTWAHITPYAEEIISPAQFPGDPQLLQRYRPPDPLSLYREIRWAAAFLAGHVDALRKFADLSERVRRDMLVGDYESCESTLDQLELELGQSLWIIKNRIACLQMRGGLEAQKEYVSGLRKSARPGSIGAYIAYHVSARNEPTVTASRFRDQMHRQITKAAVWEPLRAFLRYHILADIPTNSTAIASVLAHGLPGSVIDYYESFVMALRGAVAIGHYRVPGLLTATRALAQEIPDQRLRLLFDGAASPSLQAPAPAFPDVANLLFAGRDDDLEKKLAESLGRDPTDFDLLTLSARLRLGGTNSPRTQVRTLQEQVVGGLGRLISRDQRSDSTVDHLFKIVMNHCGSPWADALGGYLDRYANPSPELFGTLKSQYASLAIIPGDPDRISWLTTSKAHSSYAAAIAQAVGSENSVSRYTSALVNQNAPTDLLRELSPAHRDLLSAEIQFVQGSYPSAAQSALRVLDSNDPTMQSRAFQLLTHSHFRAGAYVDCLSVSVARCIARPELSILAPIDDLASSIPDVAASPLRSRISLSILFDLARQVLGGPFEGKIKDACEEFIRAQGLARPSDLAQHSSSFPRPELVYFLRHVCVQAVLDTTLLFNSSEEVLQERLAICQLLGTLDKPNAAIYQDETKRLLRDLMIRKRSRQVDERRIYVDIPGVRRVALHTLRENFDRYSAFVTHGLVTTDPEEFAAAVAAATKGVIGGLKSLTLPRNEPNDLLGHMIAEVRDLFATSPEFGLDRFLSTRIRHGTLAGQLRSPLRNAHLITQRDSATGVYERNEHWLAPLADLPAKTRDLAAGRFAQFARDFDSMLNEILTQWLRVRINNTDIGLFDFVLPDAFTRVYTEAMVSEGMDLPTFVDKLLLTLTGLLDKTLVTVRGALEQEGKQRANQLLSSLQSDLHRICGHGRLQVFDLALGEARTELQVAFDHAIDWFTLWREGANDPYTVEEAIQVAEHFIQGEHPGFDVTIHSTHTDRLWNDDSDQFESLVDIFIAAFANAVHHANLASPHVDVSVTFRDDEAVIRMENAIDPTVCTPAARAVLTGIRTALNAEANREAVTREGGTGLHKIRRTVYRSFSETPVLEFDFDESKSFFLEITLPTTSAPSFGQ